MCCHTALLLLLLLAMLVELLLLLLRLTAVEHLFGQPIKESRGLRNCVCMREIFDIGTV